MIKNFAVKLSKNRARITDLGDGVKQIEERRRDDDDALIWVTVGRFTVETCDNAISNKLEVDAALQAKLADVRRELKDAQDAKFAMFNL